MKNILRIFAFITITGLVFTGCQKEENLLGEELLKEEVQLSGEPNKVAIIDNQTYQYEKTEENSTLKGLIASETYLEIGTANTVGSTEQYQTIKVYRQPYDPDNYFYIMIENLSYDPNNNGSWVYDNNAANIPTYGRLYDWTTAENLKSFVYMNFPKTVNGRTRILPQHGELPSIQDIKDLLETTQEIGHLPSNGTNVYGGEMAFDLYYDAFVAGLARTNNYSAAYHSLAGWRDNLDVAPNNNEFNNINQKAQFWLNDGPFGDFHYPLSITYNSTPTTYLMTAYINVACADRFGFAVRYVFYPFD